MLLEELEIIGAGLGANRESLDEVFFRFSLFYDTLNVLYGLNEFFEKVLNAL